MELFDFLYLPAPYEKYLIRYLHHGSVVVRIGIKAVYLLISEHFLLPLHLVVLEVEKRYLVFFKINLGAYDVFRIESVLYAV